MATREEIDKLLAVCRADIGVVTQDIGLQHFGAYVKAVLDYIDERVK